MGYKSVQEGARAAPILSVVPVNEPSAPRGGRVPVAEAVAAAQGQG